MGSRRGKTALSEQDGGNEIKTIGRACQQDKELWYLKPSCVFPLAPDPEEVAAKVEALFD